MNNFSYVRFSSALIAALVLFAGISGCGSKVPFAIVPVHGKVAYEDGSLIPADSILVTFNPIHDGREEQNSCPGRTDQRQCPGWNLFRLFPVTAKTTV